MFPFGREAPGTDSASVRFTGHERDNLGTTSGVDDMDYMHARFYSPQMARFFQVDPVLPLRRAMKQPQSWNRYTYALNNPLKYIDPSGELWFSIGSTWTFLEGTDYIEEALLSHKSRKKGLNPRFFVIMGVVQKPLRTKEDPGLGSQFYRFLSASPTASET